jgi:hypothetical protein
MEGIGSQFREAMRRIGGTLVMCQDRRTQSRDTDDSQGHANGAGSRN